MLQDVLIEVKDDLASRIALKYACQLEKSIPFTLQALHVPDLKEYGGPPGGGWVRNKWEDVVVDDSAGKIARMVQREFPACYHASDPKIVSGKREQVIFKELSRFSYDFFIHGILHSFDPDRFYQELDSFLFKRLPCPALMVKNLTDPESSTLIIGTPDKMELGSPFLSSLLGQLRGDLELLVCEFDSSAPETVFLENDPDLVSEIQSGIMEPADRPARIRTVKGTPQGLAEFVRDRALVISAVPPVKTPMALLLAICPGAILFCPERKTTGKAKP